MKKIAAVACIVVAVLFVVFGFLYVIDHIRMKQEEPVVFSTWGRDYELAAEITPEKAIKIVKKKFDDKSKETITNFDNPQVEEIIFNKQPSIYRFDAKTNLVGKSAYKITFSTTQDELLGPVVFYVNKYGGALIGMDFRE